MCGRVACAHHLPQLGPLPVPPRWCPYQTRPGSPEPAEPPTLPSLPWEGAPGRVGLLGTPPTGQAPSWGPSEPVPPPLSEQTHFLIKHVRKPDLCCQQVALGFVLTPPLRPPCPLPGHLPPHSGRPALSDLLTAPADPRGVRCPCPRAVRFLETNTGLGARGPGPHPAEPQLANRPQAPCRLQDGDEPVLPGGVKGKACVKKSFFFFFM